jgi:hypothetical protein
VVLFKLRMWVITGPNLVSAGVYPLRGWLAILVWIRLNHAFPIVLPIRAREGW